MIEGRAHLDSFMTGEQWFQRTARHALPILISWAQSQCSLPKNQLPEHSYKDLATAVGEPSKFHPIKRALKLIGDVIDEVPHDSHWQYGKVPPIQLLVWSKGKGRPGDSAFTYFGHSRSDVERMLESEKRQKALEIRNEICLFPHWPELLALLKLQPASLALPGLDSLIKKIDEICTRRGQGESKEHLLLKEYVRDNFRSILHIGGRFEVTTEALLPSGDKVDVLIREKTPGERIFCIEVKSHISDRADHLRGVFQCVKYRAVLDAETSYVALVAGTEINERVLEVFLMTGRSLEKEVSDLAQVFSVSHRQIP